MTIDFNFQTNQIMNRMKLQLNLLHKVMIELKSKTYTFKMIYVQLYNLDENGLSTLPEEVTVNVETSKDENEAQTNECIDLEPENGLTESNLSKKPDVYDRLARAIAPSIYENTDIKKGILLQLFGGTKKTHVSLGRQNFRSELHLLLCGDPGTSKSQLLQYVYNLVPRSQYTSGRGSSAVGLTAYVTKDPETRQLVLQT